MTDTYQAIYDGVRSRMSNGDVGRAVEGVARDSFDISYIKQLAQQEISAVAYEWQRPSVVYRPTLMADGTAWCALLGDDLQSGVAGFGDTPSAAMLAFDQAFWKERTPAANRAIAGQGEKA